MEIQIRAGEKSTLDKATLESIFEGISEGVIFIDSNNRFAYLNKAAEEMAASLGRGDGKSLIGKSVLQCHPRGRYGKLLEVIDDIRRKRREFNHTILKVKDRYYDSTSSRVVSQDDRYLGVVLVNHDITEKLELHRRLEESNKELLLLQEINNAINSTMSLEEILQLTVRGITSTFVYDYCAVHFLSEDGEYLICKSYSASSDVIKKLEKLTGIKAANYRVPLYDGNPLLEIIKTKKPWLVYDIIELIKSHTDTEVIKSLAPAIARIAGTKSGIGVPLCSGDKIVGILGIGSKGELKEKDAERLENFASQVGVAFEKARLYENIRQKSAELHSVLEGIESELPPKPLEFDAYSVLRALSNPIRKRIVELLSERGKTRFTDIKRILKIKDGTKLSFHLRELKSEEMVEQDEKKKYILSSKGRRAVLYLKALEK